MSPRCRRKAAWSTSPGRDIGDLDRVRRIVKLTAWVNSDDSFDQQPFVVNGALPFQIAVEADLVVELEA